METESCPLPGRYHSDEVMRPEFSEHGILVILYTPYCSLVLHGTTAPNSAGKSHFEVIDFAVSLNETGFAIFSADADAVLHADYAVPAFSMKVLEDILVIDFTTGRLFTPRIVNRPEVGDFVPAHR